jgi:hypothetical protein
LRSGNTGASSGVSNFLTEALALLPKAWRLRCMRADSGFFAQEMLGLLEQRNLPYIVVAKLTRTVKRQAAGVKSWSRVDKNYEVAEFFAQLQGWDKERRFVVIRERIREEKAAVGRLLLDVPGYTYRVFVTNRDAEAMEVWRDYNKRAIIEQRIEELKAELHADGFCMQSFFATESAFQAVVFTVNLLRVVGTGNFCCFATVTVVNCLYPKKRLRFTLRPTSGLAAVAGNCRGITCCELTTPSVYCLWSAIFHHPCALQFICAPLRSKTGKGRPLLTATLGAEKRRIPRNRSCLKSADA